MENKYNFLKIHQIGFLFLLNHTYTSMCYISSPYQKPSQSLIQLRLLQASALQIWWLNRGHDSSTFLHRLWFQSTRSPLSYSLSNCATLWKWDPYEIPTLVFVTYFILFLQVLGISEEISCLVCLLQVVPMGREKTK